MFRIEEYEARHRDDSEDADLRCSRRDLLAFITDVPYVGAHRPIEADVEVTR